MKKLTIIAEAWLTDKEAKKIRDNGAIVWDPKKAIATIYGKEIKFVSASVEN